MQLWLTIKELFSYQPTSQKSSSLFLSEVYKDFDLARGEIMTDVDWENVKFDNSFRLGISIVALISSFIMWAGDFIHIIWPVVMIFIGYMLFQIIGTILLYKLNRKRRFNYFLCTVDLIGLSTAIMWTGQSDSPLYFIFFIPLIIQAFHRDWHLLLYYGLGGLVLYGSILVLSLTTWNFSNLVNLGSRILFMALTVGIALLAVNLLRKKEGIERRRMSRFKCMVYISHLLNGVYLLKNLNPVIEKILQVVNAEMEEATNSWSRVFMLQGRDPLMQVIQDSRHSHSDLKSSIPMKNCPALLGSDPYQVCETQGEPGCPNEGVSFFKSHICIPIRGELNDAFGILFTGSLTHRSFSEEEIQFFQFIATSLGLAIQRLKRMEELNLAFEMDSCAMASFVGSTRTIEDTFTAIGDGIRMILNADQVAIMLWNPAQGRIETKYAMGAYNAEARNHSYLMGDGLPGQALETGKPKWTYHYDVNSTNASLMPFKGILCIPLMTLQNEPLGVLSASILDPQRTFSIEEIDLASTFCTRATIAIENVLLHIKERERPAGHQTTLESDQKAA